MKRKIKLSLSDIPYLNLTEIRKKAKEFLSIYNPKNIIPVPIDEISEAFNVSVIPTKNLERDWSIDGFITSNFEYIFIDDYCYNNQEERSRFTIAHEIAHKFLHEEIYKILKIENISQYINFHSTVEEKISQRIETQSYRFAGYILIPSKKLELEIENFESNYKKISALTIDELEQLINHLKSTFKITGSCLRKHFEIEYPEIIASIESLNNNH
jgi:Zn-dependent peptidase ImmA (M78 family)